MNPWDEQSIQCPYCGETFTLLIDVTYTDEDYIEDCHICCRPITVSLIESADGHWQAVVKDQDSV